MNTAVNINPRTNFHLHLRENKSRISKSDLYESKLMAHVESFKSAVFDYIEQGFRKDEKVLEKCGGKMVSTMRSIVSSLHQWLGPYSLLSEEEKNAIGNQVRKELAPYLLLGNLPNRMYTKPRGYAGDFLTIAQMYDGIPRGVNRVGKIIDQIFIHNPACIAVQNRRGLLAETIKETIQGNPAKETNITSFACGPAQELFDVDKQLGNAQVNVNLIDIDLQALAHVGNKIESESPKMKIKLHQQNLIHLALGRKQLNIKEQDLIYSIGLIDYFDDKLVIKLINYAHSLLKEGGRLVLGNFHTNNPIKEYMDHVVDWKLIHRSEEDMNRLFKQSNFGKNCDEIRFEEEGINMFAYGVK